MQSAYELARDARVAANRARLAELVTVTLESPAPASAKRTPPPPPLPRQVSTRARPSVDYRETGGETRRAARGQRVARGERGEYGTAGAASCHSCRQRTDSYKATCTRCPLKWCAPCLRIRYGEDAHAVNARGDWACGRCRGGCLCSTCRRKAGKAPTGVLGPTAEAGGFSSVQEFLKSR